MSITIPTQTTAPSSLLPAAQLELRYAEDRGRADHGWLKTAYSFSFSNYYNPERLHFEALRVINDDWIAGGAGFPTHPHQDFEIFSYVLEGAISHRDSMGNGSTVAAGGVQYMTAGKGVQHSEFNPSATDPMRLLQIWLMPKVRGATPRYEVRDLSPEDKAGRLHLFISEDGRDGTIQTLAPAEVYAGTFDGDQTATFHVRPGRSAYVQMAEGTAFINGQEMRRGDALTTRTAGDLVITDGSKAEILVFDLAQLGH